MKMSKLALAIGALVMAGGAMAQSTASVMDTAHATVVAPITIAAGTPLEFGRIISRAAAITVNTAGNRTGDSSNTNNKGTPTAATFVVTGEPSFTYALTAPIPFLIDTTTSGTGATTMQVSAITVDKGTKGTSVSGTVSASDGTGVTGVLDVNGEADLRMGATLAVNALQVAGSYAKTYTVTVAYN